MKQPDLAPLLYRIAEALDRLAPAASAVNDLDSADAFIWHAERECLEPVPIVNRVALGLLRGIDRVREFCSATTCRSTRTTPATNR